MSTKAKPIEELAKESRRQEKERYIEKCGEFQQEIFKTTEMKFSQLAEESNNLRDIDVDFIRNNPITVRILRYLTKPTLSRDKFSDYCGVGDNSLKKYEDYEDDTTPREATAKKIIDTFEHFRNEALLPWLEVAEFEYHEFNEPALIKKLQTALSYTVAVSEANTEYRNWRATLQHDLITEELGEAGLKEVSVDDIDELQLGQYETELSVESKEADFAIKNYDGELTLIEAKMSGTKINFEKRRKEMIDDYNDWTDGRPGSSIVGVIGGMIDTSDVKQLEEVGIKIYWDHKLDDLSSYVSS